MKKGNGHDEKWESLGNDVRNFMSQNYRQSEPAPEEPEAPQDPRLATDFCAVWDQLATDPNTAHIIEYINGGQVSPVPTMRDIVAAFFDRSHDKAIFPQQISMVIAICGGQLSRHHALRYDVEAEWSALRDAQLRGLNDRVVTHTLDGIPLALSVAAFLAAGQQPEYLIEPILQRGSLYTLTGLTSSGKTAILLTMALAVASGRTFAGKHTTKGHVVWFAGENPDDFRLKVATACQFWNLDPDDLDMAIIPGAFDLTASLDPALTMARNGGDVALVVVDTSAAYRVDDAEDDNANSLAWARILRRLLTLPGHPVVLTAAHPTKYAERNNLLPRGGSSFLNEIDGNFSSWADEEQNTATLHWCGKFRGMTFAPIAFALKPCPHPTWTLRNGDPVMVKLAVPVEGEAGAIPPKYHNGQRGRPSADKADIARRILADLLVTEGTHGWAPDNLRAVAKERWRSEFYARACIAEDQQETKKKAFQRAVDRLINTNAVAANRDWVWLIHPEVE
jgi:hypothetical protein